MRARDPKLGRRPLWAIAWLLALTAVLALAACGGDDEVGGGGEERETQVAESGPARGNLTISNWPGYIDKGPNGTVAEFQDETGVNVDYNEDINDNVDFFGRLRPQLEQGQSGGRDIFIVTDWMAKQMHDLGYLQEIDHDDLGTVFDNMLPSLREPSFDPERKFSVPWQSGMTGIMVNTRLAPDLRSVNDMLDDDRYSGRITMLTELRDTVPLVLKADGIDPEDASKEDWLNAIDRLQQAVDSGQIRDFTGNEYTQDMANENVVAAIGWSGDAALIDNEDVEWRMPAEGCTLWSDNMVIPVGASNTAAALEWMNFVYQPRVQADIAQFVEYVTPVQGVADVLRQRNPELAENDLIFPDEEFTDECSTQPDPPGDAEDRQEVTEAFQDLVTQ
ncbi:MAG: spermidine/putrescine ABC transporter substrate-binding protein [Thermoleophilaceae bacterium]